MKQKLPNQNCSSLSRAHFLSMVKLTTLPGRILTLIIVSMLFLSSQSIAGTWTAVTATAPHTNGGGMLLLSDGTVICKSQFG